MEKYSEQKLADLVVTSTSTGKESLLKEYDVEQQEQLQIVRTEDSTDATKCVKCRSSDINTLYIAGHDVLHCICNSCGYEWVE